MKHINLYFSVLLFLLANIAVSQHSCKEVVFTNNFTTANGWTTVGSNASVSGGTFNLTNAYDGSYNKVYQNIGTTLSNSYFKAQCKFTLIGTNPSGNGIGALIMGLSAGSLDFYSYDASNSYAATNQDGLSVNFNSPSSTDNNINDWPFTIIYKKGTSYYSSPTSIMASSLISTYYVQLERTSKGMTRLSIFSDSNYSVSIAGSPITFAIDSTITGINTIQHGTNTLGSYSRLINAQYDNDHICDDSVRTSLSQDSCKEVVFVNNFTSANGWTTVGSSASVSGGTFNLTNAYDGSYNKVYQNIGTTLSNSYFKAQCKFTLIGTNPSGNGIGALIMGLSAGSLDFYSYDASNSYAATNQDGISVNFNSPSSTDNNINDWPFTIIYKKGTSYYSSPTSIMASSSISTYYVQLERTSKGMTRLSIFSDSNYSISIAGSPITFAIDSTITGINTIQHGTNTLGSYSRLINAQYDNDYICDDSVHKSINQDSCKEVVFTNNFTTANGWTTVGSSASVSGGTFNLTNAYDGSYNKVYQNIGTTLSNTYFKAQCKFTLIGTNPSGNGIGALIMGLSAGSLDFYSYDASNSYAATNQDGLSVNFNSPSSTDNNINDWPFTIIYKKGTSYYSSPTSIMASSSISTYYVQLERTSKGMTRLSIFSDSNYSVSIAGSPITFAIDSTITGINTIQHGTNTLGSYSRLINAQYDNDYICDNDTSVLGIPSIVNNTSLLIYPNPNTGRFSIDFNAPLNENRVLRLYNDIGQMLYTKNIEVNTKHLTLDLNSILSSGLYYIAIQGNTSAEVTKLVITK